MNKVLIFGIGGFVGNYLSREFLENEYTVFGCDVMKGEMLSRQVKFFKCDLLNQQDVKDLISKILPDIIVNLAAVSSVGFSWKIPQKTMEINVIGALNIMEAARQLNISPKIMFVGSSEEYVISDYPMSEDRPLNASNPYGISKVTQENFAKIYREQYGMRIYCVRPFNHTGVGQKDSFVLPSFCKQIAEIEKGKTNGVISVGNLSVKRDFSHVKDIVRAYRLIIESENCDIIYNVGSGKSYSLEEMLNFIIGLGKQKVEIMVDEKRFRPTDQPMICCDRSLIGSQLGWEPKYTVFDALKEMFDYYMNV